MLIILALKITIFVDDSPYSFYKVINMCSDHETREILHHDEWALSESVANYSYDKAFISLTALENKYILSKISKLNVQGKTLLDIGSGLGEASVFFAKMGANVLSLDISLGMAKFSSKLAASNSVKVYPITAGAEKIPLTDESIDFVYAANVIHHVQNIPNFISEIHRILKHDGHLFTTDPLCYNPIINIYRKIATDVRSSDEKPLSASIISEINKTFAFCEHRTFWLLSLILFVKYYLFDKVNPNDERYWKRIYDEDHRTLWWWRLFPIVDSFLTRLPLIKWLAWNIVIHAKK